MAKKAKSKKRVAKVAKLTAAQAAAVVKMDVIALLAKVATGSKTESDLVPATLAKIVAKLDAIK